MHEFRPYSCQRTFGLLKAGRVDPLRLLKFAKAKQLPSLRDTGDEAAWQSRIHDIRKNIIVAHCEYMNTAYATGIVLWRRHAKMWRSKARQTFKSGISGCIQHNVLAVISCISCSHHAVHGGYINVYMHFRNMATQRISGTVINNCGHCAIIIPVMSQIDRKHLIGFLTIVHDCRMNIKLILIFLHKYTYWMCGFILRNSNTTQIFAGVDLCLKDQLDTRSITMPMERTRQT